MSNILAQTIAFCLLLRCVHQHSTPCILHRKIGPEIEETTRQAARSMIIAFIRLKYIYSLDPLNKFDNIIRAIGTYIDENEKKFPNDLAVRSAIKIYRDDRPKGYAEIKPTEYNQKYHSNQPNQQTQSPVKPIHAHSSRTAKFIDTKHSTSSTETVNALPTYVENIASKRKVEMPPQYEYATNTNIRISTNAVADADTAPAYSAAHKQNHAIMKPAH